MIKKFTTLTTIILIVFVFAQSCKDDTSEPEPEVNEFIAASNSFTSFMSWSLDATRMGADPALGGMAHGGNDSTVTRNIYFKDGQDPVSGKYPIGTIIVKHSSNPGKTVDEYTAMVKRGNGFNPDRGDWEFFMLTNSGSIASDSTGSPMRGANLMGGMCGSCHNAASAKDFIFTK